MGRVRRPPGVVIVVPVDTYGGTMIYLASVVTDYGCEIEGTWPLALGHQVVVHFHGPDSDDTAGDYSEVGCMRVHATVTGERFRGASRCYALRFGRWE